MVPFFDVEAVPKRILELMNVDKLTRENVASHLQVIFCAQNNPLSFKKIKKRKKEKQREKKKTKLFSPVKLLIMILVVLTE